MKTFVKNAALSIIKEQGQGNYYRLNPKTGMAMPDYPTIEEDSIEWDNILDKWVGDRELITTTNMGWFDEGGQAVTLYFANPAANRRLWDTMNEYIDMNHNPDMAFLVARDIDKRPEDYVLIGSGPI